MSEQVSVPRPMKREVYPMEIIGVISDQSNAPIMNKIRGNTERLPYHIHTTGPGGNVSAGFALMDMLGSMDVNVVYFVQGFCASMNACFIQDRDFLRLCYPHTRFMFHSSKMKLEGSEEGIDNLYKNLKLYDTEIIQIVADAVGMEFKEAKRKLFTHDKFFMGKDLLNVGENGAVDGIIQTSLGDHKYLCSTRGGLKVIDTYIHQRSDIAGLPVWTKE